MPKSNGFNLYALKVYYKDGTTNICYARKTDDWFYFSDAMDFRIKLGTDNTTITEQEWRRKHYSSSWYESGLLDHVILMEFGEEYLQSELNPMRDNISTNHGDIVNNYNQFVNYQDDMWNTFSNIAGGRNENQDEYDATLRELLYTATNYNWEMANKLTYVVNKLAENFNKLVDALQAAFQHCLVIEDEPQIVNRKHYTATDLPAYQIDKTTGAISQTTVYLPSLDDQGVTIWTAAYSDYKKITDDVDALVEIGNGLAGRATSLEGKANDLESRVAKLESLIH